MGGENEPDQSRSLFCTKRKCEDKCCDVIIDRGSIENLVSKKIVKSLKLRRKKHPHPCCIGWVQDDHKVMLNE
jgi:hypothetical protein